MGAPSISIDRLLDRNAQLHGARAALVTRDARMTHEELLARADAFAAGLQRLGLGKGDNIAILMPNSIEWVVAFFGILRIGAVAVGINTRYKAAEIEQVLRGADARALVMSAAFPKVGLDYAAMIGGFLDFARPSAALPELRQIVVHGRVPEGAVAFADLQRAGDRPAPVAISPGDPAVMVFTSGTTGRPKGCLLAHRALLEAASRRPAMLGWSERDVQLSATPFASIGGVNGSIVANSFIGSTHVIIDVFEAQEAMRLIQHERVTIFYGVPTMYLAIMEHPRRAAFDLGSLERGSIGSASVPVELMRWITDERQGLGMRILVGYGQTEAGGVCHHTRFDDPPEVRLSTVGRPAEGILDRIADPVTGEPVADGSEGEICVKTPQMMTGYYKDPDATRERIRDGWLRTGDLGIRDADGNVRVTGRLSDTIIVGGFNAYPVEIENCLRQHPGVLDVAAVGIPDRRMGEVVMAFVIPRPGREPAAEALIAFAGERLARYKVPRAVRFVDAFPLNETGKVVKARLKDMASRPEPGRASG